MSISYKTEVISRDSMFFGMIPRCIKEMWNDDIDVMIGGSFTHQWLSHGASYNDIDLYGSKKVIKDILKKYRIKEQKEFSAELDVPNEGIPISLVNNIPMSGPVDYLENVDFTICSCIIHKEEERILISYTADYERDIGSGRLVYRPGTRWKFNAIGRTLKYNKRGFSIEPESMADVICCFLDEVYRSNGRRSDTPKILLRKMIIKTLSRNQLSRKDKPDVTVDELSNS